MDTLLLITIALVVFVLCYFEMVNFIVLVRPVISLIQGTVTVVVWSPVELLIVEQ